MAHRRIIATALLAAAMAASAAATAVTISSVGATSASLYPYEEKSYALVIDNNSGAAVDAQITLYAGDGLSFVAGEKKMREQHFTFVSVKPFGSARAGFTLEPLPGFYGAGQVSGDANTGQEQYSFSYRVPVDSNGLAISTVPTGQATLASQLSYLGVSIRNDTNEAMEGIVVKVLEANGFNGRGQLQGGTLNPGETLSGSTVPYSATQNFPQGPIEVSISFSDPSGNHTLLYEASKPAVGANRLALAASAIALVILVVFIHFKRKQ